MVKTFRDLIAWQTSNGVGEDGISCTTGRCRSQEQFGLTKQMRERQSRFLRTSPRDSDVRVVPDLLKFLRIARGSLNESSTQYELATDLADATQRSILMRSIRRADRVLQGLIRSFGTQELN